LPFFSAVFLSLPMNFFVGCFLFTVCSCISSRQIQSCILSASSLCVKLSWASIPGPGRQNPGPCAKL
jgi:hypothetical protein